MDHDLLTARFDQALLYARGHHTAQLRKGTAIPYFAHLMAVSSLVLEMGGDEDEAIAGLLHDVVEDGGGEPAIERIRADFGEHVLGMVLANSDTIVEPKPPWRARKEAYIAGIATKEPGALRVSLADKLHNARSILLDYRTHGDELWSRFKAGEGDSVRWYYRALSEAFELRVDALGPAAAPALAELQRTLDELDRLVEDAGGSQLDLLEAVDPFPRGEAILYLNQIEELDWLVALEFGRVDDGQPIGAWEELVPTCGLLHDRGRPVGFKVFGFAEYDAEHEDNAAAWDGPRFDVPQLGLRAASVNEIVVATRALYGTTDSINRTFFGRATQLESQDALDTWLACLQSGDQMAHFALGYTLLELGRAHEAYRHLRYYTEIAPALAWNWVYRARAAVALGLIEDARESYTVAVSLDEDEETDAADELFELE